MKYGIRGFIGCQTLEPGTYHTSNLKAHTSYLIPHTSLRFLEGIEVQFPIPAVVEYTDNVGVGPEHGPVVVGLPDRGDDPPLLIGGPALGVAHARLLQPDL